MNIISDKDLQKTKVTIVHSGDHLLNDTYPDKFRRNIERRVRERGVTVLAGDYVDALPAPGAPPAAAAEPPIQIRVRSPQFQDASWLYAVHFDGPAAVRVDQLPLR